MHFFHIFKGFFVCFRTAPLAFGSSEAKSWIGAIAASLCHSCSNSEWPQTGQSMHGHFELVGGLMKDTSQDHTNLQNQVLWVCGVAPSCHGGAWVKGSALSLSSFQRSSPRPMRGEQVFLFCHAFWGLERAWFNFEKFWDPPEAHLWDAGHRAA